MQLRFYEFTNQFSYVFALLPRRRCNNPLCNHRPHALMGQRGERKGKIYKIERRGTTTFYWG
jgi:hypothetical protein